MVLKIVKNFWWWWLRYVSNFITILRKYSVQPRPHCHVNFQSLIEEEHKEKEEDIEQNLNLK